MDNMKLEVFSDNLIIFPFEVEPVESVLYIPEMDNRGKHPDFRTKKTDLPLEKFNDHPILARVVKAGPEARAKEGDLIAIDLTMAGASGFVYDKQPFMRIRSIQIFARYDE